MFTFLKNIFIALLLLVPMLSVAGPIDKATKGMECFQDVNPEWEMGFFMGIPAMRFPLDKKLNGKKVYQTIVFPDQNGKIRRVAFLLDFHLQPEQTDYKHSRKVWKSLNRKYGEPLTIDQFWLWVVDDSRRVVMFTTGSGTIVAVECVTAKEVR